VPQPDLLKYLNMKKQFLLIVSLLISCTSSAQEIPINQTATLEQVYGESVESEGLITFNDLNIEFGYVLYQTEVEIKDEESILELENVRDYAAVYLDHKLQGTMTDNHKKLELQVSPGKYALRLYAENIGRITYGPEILDNSKGLFGFATLNAEEIMNWNIIPLQIKECDVDNLIFEAHKPGTLPTFYPGTFEMEIPRDTYLDISGWVMGEEWINSNYIGSYWEEEKQQSIQVSADNLMKGENKIVIFDLKNNGRQALKLSEEPVFK